MEEFESHNKKYGSRDMGKFHNFWTNKLRWLMPTNWICRHVSQYFNFTDNEMIRAKIKDKFRSFILVKSHPT
jgi:hypothetical protein